MKSTKPPVSVRPDAEVNMTWRFGSPVQRAQADLTRAQMQMAIVQVDDLVRRRVEKNAAEARKVAEGFRALSEMLGNVMKGASETPSDDQIVFAYTSMSLLAVLAPAFKQAFDTFTREHAPLIEDAVSKAIGEFAQWAPAREVTLRAQYRDYVRRFEQGLEAAAAEQNELADALASTDADGWDQ